MRPKVYIAIPVLNEIDNLPGLIKDLNAQQVVNWEAVFCINQPDEWWGNSEKRALCENNQASIKWLTALDQENIHIIDKSSPGKGWIGKNHGVGWARKTAMDAVSVKAENDDLILSMDADTRYPPEYLTSVIEAFNRHKTASGMSAPYYHPLTGDEVTDRCILRYEIYMRNYALNMFLINNPYAFSAIGSGMACKAADYRKVGGMTPKMSGEDFYFVQKLRKSGNIIVDSNTYIYPASRFSDRVYFGTGPAMIKGRAGNWDSYPIYHNDAFQLIKQTYDAFDSLFSEDIPSPMDTFLSSVTKGEPVWQPLRENSATADNFKKACMQRIDALRILQFLKETNADYPLHNEQRLNAFLSGQFESGKDLNQILTDFDFEKTSVGDLNMIRNFMAQQELKLQKEKGVV